MPVFICLVWVVSGLVGALILIGLTLAAGEGFFAWLFTICVFAWVIFCSYRAVYAIPAG